LPYEHNGGISDIKIEVGMPCRIKAEADGIIRQRTKYSAGIFAADGCLAPASNRVPEAGAVKWVF